MPRVYGREQHYKNSETSQPMPPTLQGKDAERVKAFLVEHTPHVVAVGAGGLEARQLKADLDTIRDSILEHHARVMTAQETGA